MLGTFFFSFRMFRTQISIVCILNHDIAYYLLRALNNFVNMTLRFVCMYTDSLKDQVNL